MYNRNLSSIVLTQSKVSNKPCDDLQALQLIDESPNSVPKAIFVRLPNETSYEHTLYALSNLSAVKNITDINVLEEHHQNLANIISQFYSRRSIMNPLQKFIKVKSSDADAISKIATQQLQPLIGLIKNSIETINACIKHIHAVISNEKTWRKGHYSDELLFSICKTFHFLFVIDGLHDVKSSIKLDVNWLYQLDILRGNSSSPNLLKDEAKSNSEKRTSVVIMIDNEMKQWLNEKNSGEKKLFDSLSQVKPDVLINVTAILYHFIKNELVTNTYVLDQTRYIYLISLYMLIKLCPPGIQVSEIPFIKNLFESTPYVPLFHEFSFKLLENLKNLDFFRASNVTFVERNVDPTVSIKYLRNKFSEVTSKLHRQTQQLSLSSSLNNSSIVSNSSLSSSNNSTNGNNNSNSNTNTNNNNNLNNANNNNNSNDGNSNPNMSDSNNIISNGSNDSEYNSNILVSLYNSVCESLKLISSTLNMLREQYAFKLANPPSEPKDMKPYEKSVRPPNYTSRELNTMLQLLALCRELQDMIRLNIPVIYPRISLLVQSTFQDFVKNSLEKVAVKARKHEKKLRKRIDEIRLLSGDWLQGENLQITAKKSSDLKTKRDVPVREAPPSLQLIELVRIEIEHFLTNESIFMKSSSKSTTLKKDVSSSAITTGIGSANNNNNSPNESSHHSSRTHSSSHSSRKQRGSILSRGSGKTTFSDNVENLLKSFVNDSKNWIKILQFEQTLAEASDQSSFYFKEVQLDINNVVQFPVKSSLPFILCQYALDNYYQPELTEIIFYPLSIYDDAAGVAINLHKSKLMFDEIQAESRVCLDTLKNLIGEFTFNAFRTFATLRQLPDKMINYLKESHSRHWPHSQAYRLRTLLQQNQYYLLSHQVALKSLIAPRVDEELNSAVCSLFKISEELGITSSLAIQRVLNIIRETHRLLIDQGLPLMPFKDIERTAMWDNLLKSFSSKYLRDIITHLTRILLRSFYLLINPIRLIPPKKLCLPAESLGKLNLGKILKDALDPSVAFVTVHHFSAMIRNLSSDGAIVVLAKHLQMHIRKSFEHFLDKYKNLYKRMTRIKDLPFGTMNGASSFNSSSSNITHYAFSRYEGAYKFFLNDKDVTSLLRAMQNIGNTIAVCELIDESLLMKEFNVVQVLSYLRRVNTSVDENIEEKNMPLDEMLSMFDEKFQNGYSNFINKRSMNIVENVQQIFLAMFITEFSSMCKNEISIFSNNLNENADKNEEENENEDINNDLDFTKMNGFASVWSVLEFVYCLMETLRTNSASNNNQANPNSSSNNKNNKNSNNNNNNKDQKINDNDNPTNNSSIGDNVGGFVKYGQGVQLTASLMLLLTKQVDLYQILSIGKKLQRLNLIDMSGMTDEKTLRYLSIGQFNAATMEWSLTFLEPFVENLSDNKII